MGAISAIDIALWDIAGKHFGVPAYQLLGGACRDRARCYVHVFGATTEELVEGCKRAKADGFSAIGHLTPFLDEPHDIPYFETHAGKMRAAIDRVRRYREAVGDSVDLCIEIHRRLSPAEAIVLGRGIEPYHPMFYEDPVRPDNFDSMAAVARQIGVPIATGERLHTLDEFAMLLSRDAVQYVRPDVCLAGGLTHTKKIAALAEAFGAGVVPHNPLSPVSTAACLQLAACTPNFSLQEYPGDEGSTEKRPIVDEIPRREGDSLLIPERPGIGIELAPDAAERLPYRPRLVDTRLGVDGSVVDQ
jgi:galactonate dehydratase